MAKNVLIIDSDPGFSAMLSNSLDSHPDFNAVAVNSSARAFKFLESKGVDLVIIDMGLEDMPALKMVKAIRQVRPELAIMIIPLMGQDPPGEIKNLNVQGILPKPFFVGDLPMLVGQAVGLNLEAEEPEAPTPPPAQTKKPASRPSTKRTPPPARDDPPPRSSPPPRSRPSPRLAPSSSRSNARQPAASLPSWKLENLQKSKDEIIEQLKQLNAEIRAEVILLTAATELIAMAGNMPEERAQELALLVAESAEAAAQAATFLGERDQRFEQSLHEGNEFRLYAYSLGQGVVLSLALGTSTPLGILRHQTKRTSQRLMKYIQ